MTRLIERQIDEQIDRQKDRQINNYGWLTVVGYVLLDRWMDRLKDRWINEQIDRNRGPGSGDTAHFGWIRVDIQIDR